MRSWHFIAAIAAIPFGAQAQQAAPDPVETLTRCRAVADTTARLACFDQAAAALETAREKKEIVVLDAGEVKRTRRSLFGFDLPRIKFLEGDGKTEPEKEIVATIESVRSLGYGKWVVRVVDAGAWQTTEPLADTPRAGAKVTIRRASLGSFFMKIDRIKGVRVMRIG